MSTRSTVRVVVVEDHPVTRMGVVALLGQDERIEVVGEAGAGEDALGVVAREHPDVVVTDLRLGDGLDGVGMTSAVRASRPAPAVLVLTTYDTDRDIVRAVEAGAAGYLLKDADPQSLVDAVRTVHEGQSLLSPQVLARLVARMPRTASTGTSRSTWAGEVEALTPRQREVLLLIARGLSNSEIEVELGITRATCRSHITALLARLGARDRAQLVIAAYEAGLISPR